MNIFAAMLAGLKGLAEAKLPLAGAELIAATRTLVTSSLTSASPLLRCTAAESVGRLAQVTAQYMHTYSLTPFFFRV